MTVLTEKKTSPTPAEEDMRQYLQDIRQYPRLSPSEERQLAIDCAGGDEEAIRRMVSSNLRLVVAVARQYAGRGVSLLDLIQEGSIGLLVAARKFDYTMDCRFSTYATKWIRQGVTRCLLNHAGLIRVPVHTAQQMHKLLAADTALTQQLGRPPEEQEIAAYAGISEKKVHQLRTLLPEVCSLDASSGEEGTLQLLLEDMHAPQPQEELVRRELQQTLQRLLSMLDSRQKQILQLHYGLQDGRRYSLEEIGKQLGISKERARQVEHQAMDRLLELGAGLGLEDFLS